MKLLLKNGNVINVFTGEIQHTNVLIENNKIIGVGDYTDKDADTIEDIKNKYICPGFIDGHIHIESTTMLPQEFAKSVVVHGTTAVIADPHEIANVCGTKGIDFMLQASKNLPINVYFMVPSCVPATKFDESYEDIDAKAIEKYYLNNRILGLAEMMNYPGVIYNDKSVISKIKSAQKHNKIINGHAPLLSGKDLDKYLSNSIQDDHECSNIEEAKERIQKGQWVMIRQGTAAKNLAGLIELFDEPYSQRCLLVTDDKHPADILANGHIDSIIRQAVELGKSAITGIQMATLHAANCFNLKNVGAIAPGYIADIAIIDDLKSIKTSMVIKNGKIVAKNGKVIEQCNPNINKNLVKFVKNSFNMQKINASDFDIAPKSEKCRAIKLIQGELLTDEQIVNIDWNKNNGIDINRDILKLAVIERHHKTGHIGKGFITGIGLKTGAIASSVSHDSHNLIVIGTNHEDMALASNLVAEMGGGMIVVNNGNILAKMPLPIAGLMGEENAQTMSQQNEEIRRAVKTLGTNPNIEPFMNMAFVSLPVIPNIKMTTHGLIDVNKQKLISLYEK